MNSIMYHLPLLHHLLISSSFLSCSSSPSSSRVLPLHMSLSFSAFPLLTFYLSPFLPPSSSSPPPPPLLLPSPLLLSSSPLLLPSFSPLLLPSSSPLLLPRVLLYLFCVVLVLVPQKLLEFRYFVFPYLLFRLHVPQPSWWGLVGESVLHVAVTVVTVVLFVNYPFRWPGNDSLQRFMW